MNTKKEKAFVLRKNGKSYKYISDSLGVSKSTISSWFKGIRWSQEIKERLIENSKSVSRERLGRLNRLRGKKLALAYKEAEHTAKDEFGSLKEDKLFITAISLYWGEGDRRFDNGIVRISNVDERLLTVFKNFLLEICKIDISKIRAGILLYPELDSDECLNFWSKEIGIPKDNFFKSTVIEGKHKKNRLGFGVCIISVHDKYLKKKVLTWLELFKNNF